jgi:hypothetical protein
MKVSIEASQKRVMEAKLEKRVLKVKTEKSRFGNASFSSGNNQIHCEDNGEESEQC